MKSMKPLGYIMLLAVGLIAVYYIFTKKLQAAQENAESKIDSLSSGLKAGLAATVGGIAKDVVGSLKIGSKAGAAASAAGTAAGFVGPLQPASAAISPAITAPMTGAGLVAGIAAAAWIVFVAFKKIFPSNDPEWKEIERRLAEAKAKGEPILSQVSKSQLKAPARV